jgi:hypothetical protein
MRVRRLLHETTCRLELAALQKADAVVDRLTFNATIIETGTTETLDFIAGWLASDPARLTPSLLDYVGHPACGPQQLRQDLGRRG